VSGVLVLLLLVVFLGMPLLEIYVIIQVGQQIGALPTVLLLLLESAFGAWLIRREGSRAWTALRTALGTGRLPGGELADAAQILVGGTLLLTPGFVTDALGFLMVLPVTRPLARRVLGWLVARRAGAVAVRRFGVGADGRLRESPTSRARRPGESGGVVQGEVVPDEEGGPGSGPDDTSPGRAVGG
jgi:UPF0716 protein FxsA